MIQSIELTNFQRHRHLHLDLSEGTNVLAGTSDSGKSSVVRAVNWALNNRPLGLDSLRWDPKLARVNLPPLEKDELTRVTITVPEHIITRERNEKGINRYVVDGEELSALRGEVPAKVLQIMNIEPYCFQGQHDQYFLLQDSAGEVAKKLNSVAGLEDIDKGLANISAMARENKRLKESTSALLGLLTEQIEELSFITDAIELVERIDEAEGKRLELKLGIDKLGAYAKERTEILGNIGAAESWLQIEEDSAPTFQKLQKLRQLEAQTSEISGQIKSWRRFQDQIHIKNKDVGRKSLLLKKRFKELGVCPLCGGKLE